MPDVERPLLSLISPFYNEEAGIPIFFNTVYPILDSITPHWEIICVDDGSLDATLPMLKQMAERDSRIRVISFSRNFGKEVAVSAGLDHTNGLAVIPMDSDLQDPPELIPQMVEKWREGYKVVLATRVKREGDPWLKRVMAHCFYSLLARVTTVYIPVNTGDFRLMDAQVVEVLRHLPERTRFMKGLFAWVGFTPAYLYFERKERATGQTKYNFRAMWRHAKDGIFSFTTLPLRVTTYLGLFISFFAFVYAAYITLNTMIYGVVTPGYASLMTVILMIGGIQLVCLGILGEYIGRIYREVKQRPLYVVNEKIGF